MLVGGPKAVKEDKLTQSDGSREVVLLLDDNALQAATRQAILQRAGYIVHIALDPANALRQLRQNELPQPIDAVISDHIMPQMSGSEFVRELRQTHADLPVMVLSGMDDAEREYAGLNVRFLLKPLAPGLLLFNLEALLQVDEIDGVA
jgi:DNA-binding response OmpR family regulator